jgi:hypothetical protein
MPKKSESKRDKTEALDIGFDYVDGPLAKDDPYIEDALFGDTSLTTKEYEGMVYLVKR